MEANNNVSGVSSCGGGGFGARDLCALSKRKSMSGMKIVKEKVALPITNSC